ncbi:MAG: DUF1592 domain-containing protein [Deltaproteobacteria bacterium]|nr:DUF1592 domain-containing protein [Deltaproteobacteria bacterium]
MRSVFACLATWILVACSSTEAPPPLVPLPEVDPGPPTVPRLTGAQYRHTLQDLFGEGLILPDALEPDSPAAGLLAVGASETSISSWGVEQYESAAYAIAQQVLSDPTQKARFFTCTPAGTTDPACARTILETWGRSLFRRPLAEEELSGLVTLTTLGSTTSATFEAGLELGLAALLQSPSFLFRVELGEAGRYGPFALASRLSFFLWNSGPDPELLAAAADGRLSTAEGLEQQARRLLADPRARRGVRAFFEDLFELYHLEALNKDPTVFLHYTTDLGKLAKEQTLQDLERIVFDEDADYRQILITDRTAVDRRLAALYGVRAGSKEGFSVVQLPPEGGRRGLLGQASFLALRAHPSSSSAVLRGAFVRKVLLCQLVPPAPVGLNTALPEPTATARTLRERNVVHLTDPGCAACHSRMDPIGLGLENFDGIGRYRGEDNGAPIDASGDLDGVPFTDAWSLAQAVHDHPDVPRCLVRSLYRYATNAADVPSEAPLIDALTANFQASGHRVQSLMLELVTSGAFQKVTEVSP